MTTPVGSIKFGLSIDGSGLPADILREINEAVQPTVAKVLAELDKLQRKLDQTGRAAEKSGAKQTAAAKATAAAVDDLGDEYSQTARDAERSSAVLTAVNRRVAASVGEIGDAHTRAAASAVAGSRVQVSSLRAVTREIDQQAAAWARLGAARTAAAATPTPGGPGRGGGGAGGGGGGRGGRGGGFLGFGGPVVGAVGWNAVAAGIGSFPAAATAITNLTGAIQQLGQAGLVLPGVIGGIVSSVGTLKLGLVGVKDGFEAAWEAAASGDPKDIEKAAEAMKNLAPATQSAVKAAVGFRDEWDHLQRDVVQQNMFDGLDKTITDLAGKSMPTLEKGLGGISKAWNDTFKELGRVGGLDSTQGFLGKIFGNTETAQRNLNKAIEPLTHGLGTLFGESSDFLPRLADGLTAVTTRFDNWITKSSQNGNLDKWINQGIDAATNFGNSLINVGKIITSITRAAGGDGGLLEALENGSTALSNFLASDEGQAKLTAFFREGREQLAQWLPILQNLGSIAGSVYQGMKDWSAVLLPALQSITGALASLPGGISGVVTAFLAWKTISGVSSLLTSITGLGSGIDALPGRADKAAGGISKALSRIALPAGLAFLGFNDMGENGVNAGNALTTIGGATVAGASIGGPVGALIGAITGLTAVLIKMNPDQFESDKDEKDWQKWRDSGGSQRVETANQVTGRNGVLMPSIYNPDGTMRPSVGQDMTAKIAAGQFPGLSLGPNGTVLQDGVPIPGLTLPPAALPPVQGPALPAPPPAAAPDRPLPVQIVNPLPGTPAPATPPVSAPSDLGGLLGGAQLPEVKANVAEVASAVQQLPEGEVKIKDPSPEVIDNLKKLDVQIENTGKDEITVKANTSTAQATIDAFVRKYENQKFNLVFNATVTGMPAIPVQPGNADGGVLPGYSPGVDNMLVPMSGGEGVLIPEAVRGLGGAAAIYAINSRFRGGLSRRGYADGGVVGGTPGVDDASELGVLRQIRDLLAGKGGSGAPLNQTASAVSNLAGGTTGKSGGAATGPFGTPLKARGNVAYNAAKGALDALGFDSETIIGQDPATYLPPTLAAGGVGGANFGGYASALSAFARTGNLTGDLTGLGLDANDPVVKAIVSARNKKKGGLSDDAIAGLVDQVLTGGGYTGTLDSSNSSLISSLQTFREKLTKGAGAGSGRGGYANVAGLTGVPMTGLATDPISAYAQQYSGGQYQFGASDLAKGLSDCSGAVSDLVELYTKGQAGPERLFSTADAAAVLKSLGAVQGAVPGALQIGWSAEHMRATLPNGVNFESGGQTGQGATYGGNAQGAAGMPNIMSLPANGAAAVGALASGGAGAPVFVTNWPGGQGSGLGGDLLSGLLKGSGQSLGGVSSDVLKAALGAGNRPLPEDVATVENLLKERNPTVLAALAGYKVGDYNRTGGQGQADNLTVNDGPGFNAQGQLYSDTAALIDRSFTSLQAQIKAGFDQLNDVLSQVRDQLAEIGSKLAQSSANSAASSAASAIPKALGGPIWGGVPGKDSVPIMAMPGEHMLTTADVAAMGGHAGVYAFRRALHGAPGFATGGGVNVNDTVGAEFFGVSQIPIIGAIVNILVRVLLAVLGVQIEARDTLGEMTDQFRQFRGEFQAFDASGRLLNDTSALMDRSQSSEEIAAQERIRILKIVIEALIKYIIEKIVVPIGKAVANAAINAGATAASGAITGAGGGPAGGIVGSLITSAGSAGVDIIAEIGTDLALAVTSVAVDGIAELLQGLFPDLMTGLFGGGIIEQLIAAPINAALAIPLAMIGMLTGGLGALFAPLAAIVGGISFDDGGVARGVGMMPKATIAPERVLSPSQTVLFERMVAALERGQGGGAGNQTLVEVHEGAIQVAGGEDAGSNVADGLMELMRG